MSGFAIRMSAYKTVNKRADPKRNFTASLARSGYSGKSKKRRAKEREIEAGFREIKEGRNRRIVRGVEKEEKCARKGETGNREIERNERNRRTGENKSTSCWPPPVRAEREKKRWRTIEEKGGNRRGTREDEEYESKRAA